MLRSVQGAAQWANPSAAAENFVVAAKSIGFALVLDGLDGRIARMTNTSSDFGREIDSLSDVISFGMAPAILAFAWGVQSLAFEPSSAMNNHVSRAGKLIAFLFLLCGAARLARFNVQKNPTPKNPGRPNRKYFVGLPIPAAAGLVAAIVYAADGVPLTAWPISIAWLALVLLLAWLMISTWRYYAFKDTAFLKPRSPVTIVIIGGLLMAIWFWSQPALLAMGTAYAASGIFLRVGGLLRRARRVQPQPTPVEEPLA